MSARIYLEGGGTSKDLRIDCRRGFGRLLESAGFRGRMPRLVASGDRRSVNKDFKTAHANGTATYVAMLIDSEEPTADPERT